MGFWDKFERMLDKFEENANNFEKKANDFLDKNFPEEKPEKTTYTSQKLLMLAKSNAKKIAGDRLLAGLRTMDRRTTKLYTLRSGESNGVYDGLDIATATIEKATSNHPNLSDVQYRVVIKGRVIGEDDYGATVARGKYDIKLMISSLKKVWSNITLNGAVIHPVISVVNTDNMVNSKGSQANTSLKETVSVATSNMIYCSECGCKNEEDASFCTQCGAKL